MRNVGFLCFEGQDLLYEEKMEAIFGLNSWTLAELGKMVGGGGLGGR